jgi:membrane protein YqaA with SNARE-associated domain
LHSFLLHLASFFSALGGFGLLLLGILDSSFLFLPLGIDLLMVGLTAQHHDRMLYYAVMAAAGSVIGTFTTDWVSRKGGEAGLEGRVSPRRLQYIQSRVKKSAGVALAVAAVAPPGFPYTPVIIVAAALQYPRARLHIIVAIFRLVRFILEGLLAIQFGPRILKIAELPVVQHTILAIVAVSIAGSAWSLYKLYTGSKRKAK